MKKALIYSPNNTLCQVSEQDFPVAIDFMWVDCDDEVKPETHYFDGTAFVLRRDVPLTNSGPGAAEAPQPSNPEAVEPAPAPLTDGGTGGVAE